MLTFIVTEYPVNTFFHHVHENNLGQVSRVLRVANLPTLLRRPIEAFCNGCHVNLVIF